jgi:hypothetical protein
MVVCGSYMFGFGVSEDMTKNVVDFGRWEINEQENGASSLKSQVQWNPCFTWMEVTIWKIAAHLCLT